jgi:hypothetical protein
LLPAVAHTYATHGIDVTWAEGVADAVDAITSGCGSRADVEKRVEELVAELVLQATDAPKIGERRSVRISAIDGRLTVS